MFKRGREEEEMRTRGTFDLNVYIQYTFQLPYNHTFIVQNEGKWKLLGYTIFCIGFFYYMVLIKGDGDAYYLVEQMKNVMYF